MIVVGGVIPPSDYDALFAAGAKAVFGPGTNIPEAAADLIDKLNVQLGYPNRRRSKEGVIPGLPRIRQQSHSELLRFSHCQCHHFAPLPA